MNALAASASGGVTAERRSALRCHRPPIGRNPEVTEDRGRGTFEGMRTLTKLTIGLVVALAPSFTGVGLAAQAEASADSAVTAQQAAPAISITKFMYNPADLTAKVGETITITNNDGFVHSVTASDGTFALDVPGKGTVTLTIPKAGSFPYSCVYHPGSHNPASITVS